MSDPLRVGSLFSGIGGIDLGLERAGMRVVWQCEANPFARKVLAKHWPDIPCYEDVRGVTNDGSVEIPDLLCGGFPCQDISFAGLGAGLGGERSGLWFEYHRIIREFRPRYVLVENVAALLVRGLDRVLGSLAAIGYDAEWSTLSACSLGAPHSRERLFLFAYPSGIGRQRFGAMQPTEGAWNLELEGLLQSESRMGVPAGSRGRISDGLPHRSHRLKSCGNSVAVPVAEFLGVNIVAFHRSTSSNV